MIGARLGWFLADESGAVTVDWLALSAAGAGVCVLAVGIIGQSTSSASAELADALRDVEVAGVTFVEIPSDQSPANSDDLTRP